MTVVTFGSFPNKTMSEFSDATQNAYAPHVTLLDSDWVAGKAKARFTLNLASPPPYKPDSNMRIHALGNPTISSQFLTQGVTFYKAQSIRWTSGSPLYLYAGEEIHASGNYTLAAGPAPANWGGIHNGKWTYLLRGSSNPNSSSFVQHLYGSSPQSDDNGVDRRAVNRLGR